MLSPYYVRHFEDGCASVAFRTHHDGPTVSFRDEKVFSGYDREACLTWSSFPAEACHMNPFDAVDLVERLNEEWCHFL